MENQVIISIPDQINASTPIIIMEDINITHRSDIDEGDYSIPEELKVDLGDNLRFTSNGADFKIYLDEKVFEPSGEIKIPKGNSVLVRVKGNPGEGTEIHFVCCTCPILPIEAQKKIIVRNVGETVDVRLGNLLNKMKLLEGIIQKRIHK